MRLSAVMKPLDVLLYCRFRCQGSEKLGSECTQNTCSTGVAIGLSLVMPQHEYYPIQLQLEAWRGWLIIQTLTTHSISISPLLLSFS